MRWNNQKIAVGKGLEKLMKTYEKIAIDKDWKLLKKELINI